jgi:hypothetical protein
MKKLTRYSKNGRRWEIIKRVGNLAIATDGKNHYEVFHIQSHNGRQMAGRFFEPAEYSPSNEQWGSLGWSYSDLTEANIRFDAELNKLALTNS